ncbi:MAG: adenosylmethionine decarboxylase [Kofleriaceae bacterium]
MIGGIEWIVDAFECRASALRDRQCVATLFERIVDEADLHVVTTAEHVFEGAGGVTVMYLLAESHLTIHTFPEVGTATLNLYCCRPRAPLDWARLLEAELGAGRVTVRTARRGDAPTISLPEAVAELPAAAAEP